MAYIYICIKKNPRTDKNEFTTFIGTREINIIVVGPPPSRSIFIACAYERFFFFTTHVGLTRIDTDYVYFVIFFLSRGKKKKINRNLIVDKNDQTENKQIRDVR